MNRDRVEFARAVVVKPVALMYGQHDAVAMHAKGKRVVDVKDDLGECNHEQRLKGENLHMSHGAAL